MDQIWRNGLARTALRYRMDAECKDAPERPFSGDTVVGTWEKLPT